MFTGVSERDLRVLEAEFVPPSIVPARADLVTEGQGTDHLHVIIDGWACRYRLLPNGGRQFPALLVPGDICDLDGLLLRRVHYGVAALTACTVATVPHARLRAILEAHPALRDAFWWLTFVENSISNEWTVNLGRRSALERAAHLFCELLARLWPVGIAADHAFPFPLTQEELADVLGLTPVHVNRTLQELRARDLVMIKGRRLVIHDLDGLQALAGFNADHLHLEGMRGSSPARH